jgi:hypothetical protein
MHDATSKDLYIMNGGVKRYIYSDGFGDIYKATPEEEAEWAAEIVTNALVKIEKETNRSPLEMAISNLAYHKYSGLEALLLSNIHDADPVRQIVFATALWKITAHTESFNIILQNLKHKREGTIYEMFLGLNEFKDHEGVRHFLVDCLQGSDDELIFRAQRTIEHWAWSGMPALRGDKILTDLLVENKGQPSFRSAIEKLKEILNVT